MINGSDRVSSFRAPFLSLGWNTARVTMAQGLAMIPPVLAALALRGPGVLAVLAAALFTALFWEVFFATTRGRALTAHGVTTALIVAVMVPASLPLWQIGIAVTMGVVLSELVFGGRGFGFLNAAAATMALLIFSFPGVKLAGGEGWIAVACLPGAALLLASGLISWRVLLAAALSYAAIGMLADVTLPTIAALGALAFGLVFLACDPIGAASTDPGRWLYGALVGALVLVFGGGSQAVTSTNAVVFAVLLASIFAPLLDQLVILHHARRRARRAGSSHG